MRNISVYVLLATVSAATSVHADLVTARTYTGNYGVEVRAFGNGGSNDTSGTITLSDIPAGATIVDAFAYTDSWLFAGSPAASINGNGLGSQAPFAQQASVYAYRWNATPFVTGNGDYTLEFGPAERIFFGALVVVFSHPSLVPGTTVINDGVAMLNGTGGSSSSSTSFAGLLAGPSRLQLVTQADNDLGQSDETILWNGATIGGPIDANLGPYASLFDFAVDAQAGSNTVTLNAPTNDQFGWHIAVVSNGLVPAPGGAAALGLAGLFFARRRRN